MCLERLSFCSQGAIHVHTLLEKSVENRHQRRLMVVPPEAELLVVVHDADLATRRALSPTNEQIKTMSIQGLTPRNN